MEFSGFFFALHLNGNYAHFFWQQEVLPTILPKLPDRVAMDRLLTPLKTGTPHTLCKVAHMFPKVRLSVSVFETLFRCLCLCFIVISFATVPNCWTSTPKTKERSDIIVYFLMNFIRQHEEARSWCLCTRKGHSQQEISSLIFHGSSPFRVYRSPDCWCSRLLSDKTTEQKALGFLFPHNVLSLHGRYFKV